MKTKEIILGYVGQALRKNLESIPDDFFNGIEEIRLRVDKPVLVYRNRTEFIIRDGCAVTDAADHIKAVKCSHDDIISIIELISDYSLYAVEEELRMGYITIPGGHRIGITGKSVIENGQIKTLKNINALNIRISHEIKGCADRIMDYITMPLRHTVVISPPGCGKTTLLRDIVRQLSDGIMEKFQGVTVGVADERSEIAGCYRGIAQNDIGLRTDVLDGCPKTLGMTVLLRSMSPRVIAVDEIGSRQDLSAIEEIINAGVTIICTAHGNSLQDMKELYEKRIFNRYIILQAPGVVSGIYDSDGKSVAEGFGL